MESVWLQDEAGGAWEPRGGVIINFCKDKCACFPQLTIYIQPRAHESYCLCQHLCCRALTLNSKRHRPTRLQHIGFCLGKANCALHPIIVKHSLTANTDLCHFKPQCCKAMLCFIAQTTIYSRHVSAKIVQKPYLHS